MPLRSMFMRARRRVGRRRATFRGRGPYRRRSRMTFRGRGPFWSDLWTGVKRYGPALIGGAYGGLTVVQLWLSLHWFSFVWPAVVQLTTLVQLWFSLLWFSFGSAYCGSAMVQLTVALQCDQPFALFPPGIRQI